MSTIFYEVTVSAETINKKESYTTEDVSTYLAFYRKLFRNLEEAEDYYENPQKLIKESGSTRTAPYAPKAIKALKEKNYQKLKSYIIDDAKKPFPCTMTIEINTFEEPGEISEIDEQAWQKRKNHLIEKFERKIARKLGVNLKASEVETDEED